MAVTDKSAGLGVVIQKLRKGADMTQAELATAVGLERTSITNIEKGNQLLSVVTLVAIADAVGFDVEFEFTRRKQSWQRDLTALLVQAAEGKAVQIPAEVIAGLDREFNINDASNNATFRVRPGKDDNNG